MATACSDFAFPFRIDPTSGQAAQSPYPQHIDEMIRQVLLTTPGERANLPSFGCGLRQLLFAPDSTALEASTQILVPGKPHQMAGNQIQVQKVTVSNGAGGDDGFVVQVQYVLIQTQSLQNDANPDLMR